jgi:hypothetical protein
MILEGNEEGEKHTARTGSQWLIPIILGTWEAEIRRIIV